ncbi:MAG: transketolase [Clostridia bacterium]|jgi:transketolase|nr:transketolase [Clostridia bacterium]
MINEKVNIKEIEKKAYEIRHWALRAVHAAKSGHPGGSLSEAEILAVLYFNIMDIDPKNPEKKDRDRFVLSKGHACPGLYSALALKGYFNTKELLTFRNINSNLQGHPALGKIKGIDMSTGSLGQGLSAANGMALAGKLDDADYRVYALLGDGEIEEGQIWEAAMTSAHYKLDNLCAILDRNGLQIDGKTCDVMNSDSAIEKFLAFGWNVIEVDGHNAGELMMAFEKAEAEKGRPTIIVANTIKGKGVSFMEDNAGWHGKAPSDEELEIALKEIDEKINAMEVN